ncbi:M56 family metallopeptidase [Mucilaginibacter glaciei]|uniref:M48 family metalloprotease n=1 Tax=Mucilaginibacter glaciei TaxID=2772109 RepID=A0A926S1Q6_9SPHI|nr:M56 family metallopeptidase [Mucilaginibacter glaciei]MBD1394300.1 M48 family metalloprotease [Mucilaginibacter glaciei]
MENILYNISQVIGISIIHSLWQGLLIYFLLRLALLFAACLPSSKKYLLAVSSLLAITAWFAFTLFNEVQAYNWLAVKPANLANMPLLMELPSNMRRLNEQSIRYYYSIERYLPYVACLYVLGLLLNAGKLIWSRSRINTIKHTMSLDVVLQQQITRFAERFEITKKVKVGLSKMVDVPCIVGYLKPVILLPFTLSTYLSDEEIEAILMHELAHIKRNDYLMNVAQQVITTLLFFNPCVLLINKIIGEERENSCDDLVVDATQNPIIYAKALFKLEQTRQNELQLALAVTGKKYHLLNRIERIMKTKKQTQSVRPTLVAMLILTAGVGCMALLNPEIAQGKISVKAIKPAIENLLADTIRKPAVSAKTKTDKTAARAKYKVIKFNQVRVDGKDNVYYNNGMKDPQLERLAADVDKHAKVIGEYYDSDKFKAFSADMEKHGKDIDAFYNSDRIKQATAAQEKVAKEFEAKWGGKNSKMEQTGKQMEALGKEMETYFNSPAFKEADKKLKAKYDIKNNYGDSRDENYRKYQAEMQANLSPEIKETTARMKKLGDEMRNVYGADMRKDADKMRAMGDSMRRAFQNPDIKVEQDEIRRAGDKMRAYADNPEIKKQKEELRKASEKLRAYTQTPEFKAKVKEWRATHPEVYNWNNNENEIPAPAAPAAPPAAPANPDSIVKP